MSISHTEISSFDCEGLLYNYEKPQAIDGACNGLLTYLGDYFRFRSTGTPAKNMLDEPVEHSDGIPENKDSKTNDGKEKNGTDKSYKRNKNHGGGIEGKPDKKKYQGRPSTPGAAIRGSKTCTEHNQRSIKRAIRIFKDLVLANATHNRFRRHIVLSYKGIMSDWNVVGNDFKKFMRKLENATGKSFSFLYIVEPDDLGSWHIHLILLGDVFEFNLTNELVYQCWQQGSVSVTPIRDLYGLVQYFNVSFKQSIAGEKLTKAQKKGSRVHFYPPNARIFRRSRGIANPKKQEMTYEEALKIIGDCRLRAATNLWIVTAGGEWVAHIQTELFEDSALPDIKEDKTYRNFLTEPDDLPLFTP